MKRPNELCFVREKCKNCKLCKKSKKREKKQLITIKHCDNISIMLENYDNIRVYKKDNGYYKEMIISPLYQHKDKKNKEVKGDNEMANLMEAAKFLCSIHFESQFNRPQNERDFISVTKIGKLLTIAELSFLKQGKVLFCEEILTNGCGTSYIELFEDFQDFYPSLHENLPVRYCEDESVALSDNEKQRIRDVYNCFAEKQCKTLGNLLDEFKTEFQDDNAEHINKDTAITLLSDDDFIRRHAENEIIDYITNNF